VGALIGPREALRFGALGRAALPRNFLALEHDKVLENVVLTLLNDGTHVYKQFAERTPFRRFVTDMVYGMTNEWTCPLYSPGVAAAPFMSY
jgi:hypothetical protein